MVEPSSLTLTTSCCGGADRGRKLAVPGSCTPISRSSDAIVVATRKKTRRLKTTSSIEVRLMPTSPSSLAIGMRMSLRPRIELNHDQIEPRSHEGTEGKKKS